MIKEYQVTLMCSTGQYKPVSTIVKADTTMLAVMGKEAWLKDVRKRGINAICVKRYWSGKDLEKYHYTQCKMRVYDKEKIARENAERCERIKIERGWKKVEETP